MNERTPFFYFKVWRGLGGKLVGQELTIGEYLAHLKNHWRLMSFPGHKATVAIVFEDMTITRQECLAYAIAFMEGRMVRIDVNLNTTTVKRTLVIPPP